MLKSAARSVWAFLKSPQATRLEIALAMGIYEAIRASLGHA